MNRNILLVGCGAEIGSTLLSLLYSKSNDFYIDTVVTNQIGDGSLIECLDGIVARLLTISPELIDQVKVNYKFSLIEIAGHNIKFYFENIHNFDTNKLGSFFVTIIATSKKDVSDVNFNAKFANISEYVLGVAESENHSSFYPNLIDLPLDIKGMARPKLPGCNEKVFALGSCQSNGWHAQLALLIKSLSMLNVLNELEFKANYVDIVHPDTPQGRLGTRSMKPREQEARNNLRPSHSQIKMSMDKIFPVSNNQSAISLRVLTDPPGYQIYRAYFNLPAKINKNELMQAMRSASEDLNCIRLANKTLGSRAYTKVAENAIVLLDDTYFSYKFDPFGSDTCLSEVLMQSYISNTRGYCFGVVRAIAHLCDQSPLVYKKI